MWPRQGLGERAAGEPQGEEMGAPSGVHHETLQGAIFAGNCGWQDGNVSVSRNIPQGTWALAAPQPDPEPTVPKTWPFLTAISLCSAPPDQPQEDTLTSGQASTSSGSYPQRLLIRTNVEAGGKHRRIKPEAMPGCFCCPWEKADGSLVLTALPAAQTSPPSWLHPAARQGRAVLARGPGTVGH